MNVVTILKGLLIFMVTLVIAVPSYALAADPIEPLIFLPRIVGDASSPTSVEGLLQGLFQLSISIGAILAVIMIAVGGIEYMGSDAISSKQAGRERMFNAVLGLVLILGTYVILNTINPNLLSFAIFSAPGNQVESRPDFPTQAVTNPGSGPTQGVPAGTSG